MGNYDFKKDLKIAETTEMEIAKLIHERLDVDIEDIEFGNTKDYDIRFPYRGKYYTVEIKEDFMCAKTGNVCVEYESRGKPSGINSTKASMYFYKIHQPDGNVVIHALKTDRLREMIEKKEYYRIISGGDAGSFTRSYLFKLGIFKYHSIELGS